MGRKAEEIREEMRKLEEKLDEGKIKEDIFKMRYRNLEIELEETRGKSTRGGKEEEFIDLGDGITVRKFTGGMVIGGHYRVEKELGRGGMGVVYKAEDTEFEKERIVAVKILPEQLKQDKEGVEEFRREFVTATRLVHQNICCTYEFGQDPGLETYFIVMEYLEGETLRREIKKRGKYRIEEAMWIIKGIAQGLGHAHKKGVLHLDMKPANVMLIGDEVKVMDFGLARKINASMSHVSMKKSAGTPLYMAPEQVDPGKAIKKVSVETDIWGLGVTVYEMLSGVVPFQGTTEYQLSQSILHAEPERIDGLRDHEWKALKGTLEKEVEKRCKSCDEFWKAIEGTAERERKEEERRRKEEEEKQQRAEEERQRKAEEKREEEEENKRKALEEKRKIEQKREEEERKKREEEKQRKAEEARKKREEEERKRKEDEEWKEEKFQVPGSRFQGTEKKKSKKGLVVTVMVILIAIAGIWQVMKEDGEREKRSANERQVATGSKAEEEKRTEQERKRKAEEERQRRIEEEKIREIRISPGYAKLKSGESVEFSPEGRNKKGNRVRIEPEWEADGGSIDSDGKYTAGSYAGTYKVKVRDRSSGVSAEVRVEIKKEEKVAEERKEVSSDGRYWVSQSGVINDTKTGLQWYVGPDQDTNWDQAKAWAVGLSVDGGGWRMPTKEELKELYQKGKGTRNMDPVFKTTGWWVWSVQLYTYSSCAWFFGFDVGREDYIVTSYSFNDRGFAVRSRR